MSWVLLRLSFCKRGEGSPRGFCPKQTSGDDFREVFAPNTLAWVANRANTLAQEDNFALRGARGKREKTGRAWLIIGDATNRIAVAYADVVTVLAHVVDGAVYVPAVHLAGPALRSHPPDAAATGIAAKGEGFGAAGQGRKSKIISPVTIIDPSAFRFQSLTCHTFTTSRIHVPA